MSKLLDQLGVVYIVERFAKIQKAGIGFLSIVQMFGDPGGELDELGLAAALAPKFMLFSGEFVWRLQQAGDVAGQDVFQYFAGGTC